MNVAYAIEPVFLWKFPSCAEFRKCVGAAQVSKEVIECPLNQHQLLGVRGLNHEKLLCDSMLCSLSSFS